ncbi:hypothetical protein ACFYVL_43810 [Streptomyces sp. NPDC004111]|uniref:hypothetical protein n=1 Tax=Streptomyces sp. NPDC004111 TaxID=3364690 RepID=UPI0036B31532
MNWEPLGLDLPWKKIEAVLGTSLPEDYKQLAETFGKGEFSDFLRLILVDNTGQFDLLRIWRSYCEVSPARESDPVFSPYHVYRPDLPGLIPWAFGEWRSSFFWLASAREDPNSWPILARSDNYSWHQVNMSTSEFTFRLLTDSDFDPFSIAGVFPEPDFYSFDGVG